MWKFWKKIVHHCCTYIDTSTLYNYILYTLRYIIFVDKQISEFYFVDYLFFTQAIYYRAQKLIFIFEDESLKTVKQPHNP